MTQPNLRTLVLNQGYEPIRVVTWQRAITMVWLDKASVLSEYEEAVRSKHLTWQVPAVIWLRHKTKRFVPEVKLTRHYIYARDNWRCQYCGEQFPAAALTFDHVVPRARGGRTSWTNVVTCCTPCNQRKGDQLLGQVDMMLLRKPRKPSWMPALLVKSFSACSIPTQWHDFVGWLRPAA